MRVLYCEKQGPRLRCHSHYAVMLEHAVELYCRSSQLAWFFASFLHRAVYQVLPVCSGQLFVRWKVAEHAFEKTVCPIDMGRI